jgi:hypothetical protein
VTTTRTASPTHSATFTVTTTRTASPTHSATFTETPTRTGTPTHSATFTWSPTATPSPTGSPTALGSFSPSPSCTPGSPVVTALPSASGTPTMTPVPTATPKVGGGLDSYIYPSPCRGDTASVAYYLTGPGQVTLKIYNEAGHLAETVTEFKPGSWQSSVVATRPLAPGAYYYLLTVHYATGQTQSQGPGKFVVLH